MDPNESEGCLQSQNEESETRFISVLGINCITILGSIPYFFLFAELDVKNKDHKRRILKYFAKNKLSVYCYETSKGWHFISPCLLTLEQWLRIKFPLRKMLENYYEFVNIRWSKKPNDPETELEFFMFNDNFDFVESSSLHNAVTKRFGITNYHNYSYLLVPKQKKTIINFIGYTEFMLDGEY